MKSEFFIKLAKRIPSSYVRHQLAKKFQKKYYGEYLSSLKNPVTFNQSSKEQMKIKLELLEKCLINGLDGEVIECGVLSGGSAFQIAKKMKTLGSEKNFYALDTFEGHPYDDYEDMPKELILEAYKGKKPQRIKGVGKVDLELIKKSFSNENLDNTIFLKGLFEDSFKLITDKRFCFAHIDADTYKSVKQCIEFFKERMVLGGIMLLDDYDYYDLEGCNKAVDDLLGRDSLVLLKPGAYWIKP